MQEIRLAQKTSGGLLITVLEKNLEELTAYLDREGQSCWIIGRVVEGRATKVGQRCLGGA